MQASKLLFDKQKIDNASKSDWISNIKKVNLSVISRNQNSKLKLIVYRKRGKYTFNDSHF
jgi:hypothetical protein